MQGDSLLYSFDEYEETETDNTVAAKDEELMSERRKFEEICIGNGMHGEMLLLVLMPFIEMKRKMLLLHPMTSQPMEGILEIVVMVV